MDANMLSMLGSFDFQKLLDMQKEEAAPGVTLEQQPSDLIAEQPIPNAGQSPTYSSEGEEDMSSIINIAELALAFL